MEKRYQVFISSTFQDLEGARQEVSQALLRADCFPAGMELFPATDEEQFEFIKQVIQQSDYYIIISAGRYGSIHPETGLSYTEMEYDYAVEIGKPVIRLLHKDPFNKLTGDKIERSDKGRESLAGFRTKLSASRLVRYWEDSRELGVEVVFGLLSLQKQRPADGWVRIDDSSRWQDGSVEVQLRESREQITKLISDLDGKDRRIAVLERELSERAAEVSDLRKQAALELQARGVSAEGQASADDKSISRAEQFAEIRKIVDEVQANNPDGSSNSNRD